MVVSFDWGGLLPNGNGEFEGTYDLMCIVIGKSLLNMHLLEGLKLA